MMAITTSSSMRVKAARFGRVDVTSVSWFGSDCVYGGSEFERGQVVGPRFHPHAQRLGVVRVAVSAAEQVRGGVGATRVAFLGPAVVEPLNRHGVVAGRRAVIGPARADDERP